MAGASSEHSVVLERRVWPEVRSPGVATSGIAKRAANIFDLSLLFISLGCLQLVHLIEDVQLVSISLGLCTRLLGIIVSGT